MRYQDLSQDDAQLAARQAVKAIVDAYGCVAFNVNNDIARGFGTESGSVYHPLQRALVNAIRIAYGMTQLKAERVLNVWQDCQEDIDYCVAYVRANRTSRAYDK